MMMLGKQEDCFALGPWWLLSSVTASIINTDWVLGGLSAEEAHIVTLFDSVTTVAVNLC